MTRKHACLVTLVLLAFTTVLVPVAEARYYHPTLGRWITRDPINDVSVSNNDALSQEAVAQAKQATFEKIYAGELEQHYSLALHGYHLVMSGIDRDAGIRIYEQESAEIKRLLSRLDRPGWAWPVILYHSGANIYQYVGSAPVDRTDPTGLIGLPKINWSKVIDNPLFRFVECFGKCVEAGNNQAAKWAEKHAAATAAVAVAETAAAIGSIPLKKGVVMPGQEETKSLARTLAVRGGWGAALPAATAIGRYGHWGVVGTAIGVALGELGLEAFCAAKCAECTNFDMNEYLDSPP